MIAVEKQDGSLTQISPLKQESLGRTSLPKRLMGMLNHLLAVENETERRARLQSLLEALGSGKPKLEDGGGREVLSGYIIQSAGKPGQ